MPDADRNYRKFLLSAVLLATGLVAFSFDVPTATRIRRWTDKASKAFSRDTRDWLGNFDRFEPFGHGVGVAFVLLAIHQLDRSRRWALPRVLACVAAGGLAADVLKMLVVRIRPYDLPLLFHGSVWETFKQWLPGLGGESGMQSFPSAHTATAAGLAAGLIWLYPQGRLLFSTLVVLVGCQRVAASAHFPSDVLIGAATGCLASAFILNVGGLARWFDRREAHWRGQ